MRKTFYYTDELHDDFARSNGKIRQKKIDGTYKYRHDNIFYKIGSFVLYRLIATPIGWLYNKLGFGMHIVNRKALRSIKSGYYLYGNHTQDGFDAFNPSMVSFPRANKIIVNPDAVNIPVFGAVTPMLGAVPLPSTIEATRKFLAELKRTVDRGGVVTVYPEAHIWPYYNEIRPFIDASFAYPLKHNVPVVAMVTTYRLHKLFKNLPPLATVYISDPIYPDECANKRELRDKVYDFMVQTIRQHGSVGYHTYIKKEQTDHEDSNSL